LVPASPSEKRLRHDKVFPTSLAAPPEFLRRQVLRVFGPGQPHFVDPELLEQVSAWTNPRVIPVFVGRDEDVQVAADRL